MSKKIKSLKTILTRFNIALTENKKGYYCGKFFNKTLKFGKLHHSINNRWVFTSSFLRSLLSLSILSEKFRIIYKDETNFSLKTNKYTYQINQDLNEDIYIWIEQVLRQFVIKI